MALYQANNVVSEISDDLFVSLFIGVFIHHDPIYCLLSEIQAHLYKLLTAKPMFSPKSQNELKRVVEECLTLDSLDVQ